MPVVFIRDVSEIPRAMYQGLSAMLKQPGLSEREIAGLRQEREKLAAYLRKTGGPAPDTDEPACLLLDSADLQAVLGDCNYDAPWYAEGHPRSREARPADYPSREEIEQLIAELAALCLGDAL